MASLRELRIRARLSRADCRLFFRVSESTWRRWENGYGKIPNAVIIALDALSGDLSRFSKWEGWTVTETEIYSPEGIGYRPADLRCIPLLHAQIAELKRELRLLNQRPENDNLVGPVKMNGYELNNVIPIQIPDWK